MYILKYPPVPAKIPRGRNATNSWASRGRRYEAQPAQQDYTISAPDPPDRSKIKSQSRKITKPFARRMAENGE